MRMEWNALVAWAGSTSLFGISLWNALLALGAAVGSHAAMAVTLRWVLKRAGRLAGRSANHTDDAVVEVLSNTNRWLLGLAALLIGLGLLDLPARWSDRVGRLWFVALVLQFALWAGAALKIALRRYGERHAANSGGQIGASATLLSWVLRTLLWTIVALAVLSNMGVNITAFVASLGVGGIAVALAVQNILGDLFASLAIALDKPFEVGDAISVGGVSGSVEHVGLKTTRIRAVGGEQIVMANAELLKNTVSNYKRLAERRVVFKFGLDYATTPEQAAAVPDIVRRIVSANDKLRFDRAHLRALGESSLDYEVVYSVVEADYQLHMDQQQRLILELMRELDGLGVQFAFPRRSVHLTDERAPAPPTPPAWRRAAA